MEEKVIFKQLEKMQSMFFIPTVIYFLKYFKRFLLFLYYFIEGVLMEM